MEYQVVFFVFTLLWSYALSQSCVTPLGTPSNCVSIYDCKQLLAVFEQQPLSSNVISFLRQSQCGFAGQDPKVCCGPLPTYKQQQPTISRTTQRPYTPKLIDPVFEEDAYPMPQDNCGIETNDDRIFGGVVTDLDEFPWMTLIGYLTSSKRTTFQCGGALINLRTVLTAAHCLTGAILKQVGTPIVVRLGEYDTQNDTDCLDGTCADPPQDIDIQGSYPHSGYRDANRNKQDDIGLIRLARRAQLSFYVQPICLPQNNRLDAQSDVYVAGWGKTEHGQGSPVKLKLILPVFEKAECTRKYAELRAALTNNQVCAGGVRNKDACRGDSGGPLMRKRAGAKWEEVGIVSFGNQCGYEGWPGVYTLVAGYMDWIQSTMRQINV